MKRYFLPRRILLTITFLAGLAAIPLPSNAQNFDNRSIKGNYATTIDGVFTFANKLPLGLPTWFTGIVVSDGKGRITSFRGHSIVGGCMVVSHEGSGTYEVNPDGTATAIVRFSQSPASKPNTECPNDVMAFVQSMAPTTIVELELVLDDPKTLSGQIINKADTSGNPTALGGRVTAHRQ